MIVDEHHRIQQQMAVIPEGVAAHNGLVAGSSSAGRAH